MIKLDLDIYEFGMIYCYVNDIYSQIKLDEKMECSTWDPTYKRKITKFKNKLDKIGKDL